LLSDGEFLGLPLVLELQDHIRKVIFDLLRSPRVHLLLLILLHFLKKELLVHRLAGGLHLNVQDSDQALFGLNFVLFWHHKGAFFLH